MCQGSGFGHDGHCGIVCPLGFGMVHPVLLHAPRTVDRVSNALVQAPLGVGSVYFWSFPVAWTGGGGSVGWDSGIGQRVRLLSQ